MLGLPEGVERLIKAFAQQPTPSAQALHAAMRQNGIFDARARAPCQFCQATVCGARWWRILEDGSVHTFYHVPSAHCEDCRGDWEDGVEEAEVCQFMGRKSTWETMWENSTGEMFNVFCRDKVRSWVLKQINDNGV